MKYVLSIDAGTTSSRALMIEKSGEIVGIEQKALTQHYPDHGWIEHNPEELWETQCEVIKQLLLKTGISARDIACIGIANQRETTIVWEKDTGKPIWNAIVWNDRRTKDSLAPIKANHEKMINQKTGLLVESYFSASKIDWILSKVNGARERAKRGELLFGTVNTWILWHLTNRKVFTTDVANASRTLLFNIHTLNWDDDLLQLFNIPRQMLPEVRSNSELYGKTPASLFGAEIPITAMVGDQQASLFGNACFEIGDIKCTYGTGSFMMINTGTEPKESVGRLLTTVAWQFKGQKCEYALEGLVYAAGSVVSWLKDMVGMIRSVKEIESLAYSVPDSGGIYFVPTLNGLASPYWNDAVRGAIFGITTGTNIGHLARGALEGIAYRVTDVLEAMQKDAGTPIRQIKCDGGMSGNLFLMQIQADLFGVDLIRSSSIEMTALGAGYLAGLAVGFWRDLEEIKGLWSSDRKFSPEMDKRDVAKMRKHWSRAIELTQNWAEEIL